MYIGPWWPAKAALVRNYLEIHWPCAGGLSAVNAIGTQLLDPINSGLTRWRMAVSNKYMDAAAELGRNPVSKHQIQPEYGDEQADAGRDYRAHLARPTSQARTRTGKHWFSLFSWPRAGLATLPGWSIPLLYVWQYIHTRTGLATAYITGYGWGPIGWCEEHTHTFYPEVFVTSIMDPPLGGSMGVA